MGNDAGISIGAVTASFDTRASFSIEYGAQPSGACLVGVHVRATSVAPTCQVVIGAFDLAGTGAASARLPLEIACADGDTRSGQTDYVTLACDFKSQPPTVHVEARSSALHLSETVHVALPPLPPVVSVADRAVLEKPVTFAKKSAALSEPMDALVVQKAKILASHPMVTLWLTGTADELNAFEGNLVLSEKRSAAVMHILERWIPDKKRLNRFSTGDAQKRGAGVFFEVKLPE